MFNTNSKTTILKYLVKYVEPLSSDDRLYQFARGKSVIKVDLFIYGETNVTQDNTQSANKDWKKYSP